MPILTALRHWAESQPDRLAVAVDGERVTYARLRERVVGRIGPATPGQAPAGALTVLDSATGVEAVVQFLAGVAGSGCVAVLDPRWPAEQRAGVLERLRGLGGPAPASAVPGEGMRSADVLDDGPAESTFLYGFTSGTTALPKAYSRTRGSWQRSLERSARVLHLGREDRTLAPGPLTTSMNLYALVESLRAGGSFHTLEQFDVDAVLRSLEHDGITRLVAVPTVLRLLADRARAGDRMTHGLGCIVSAGAALDGATTALLQRWAPEATIASYYGAAELGFVAAQSVAPGDPPARLDTAVGRPFPGVRLRIAHDDGRPVPTGQPGTIQVQSDLVCAGYLWGDDGAAFERIGDWCTVGDQGFVDHAGVLHVLGRRSDMIQSAGSNVYPQQIEAVLHAVPGVRAAVVTGRPDVVRGTRVAAAVIGDPGLTATGLRAACVRALPGSHRPREFFTLTALPVTPAGKISRSLLADWIQKEDPRVRRIH